MTSSRLILAIAATLIGCSSDPVVVNVVLPTSSTVRDMSVTSIGRDDAGIHVTPVGGLTTTASGGKATFTVVLTAQPAGAVTIGLASSDPSQGTVSPASLTFTVEDWSAPQSVTVTGVDDGVANGNHLFTIRTSRARSADPNYDGIDAADVSVLNIENLGPGFRVTPTSGLTTKFGSATASFTVRLETRPSADVTVGLTSNDVNQGTVSPSSLLFTSADWATPQTVTVTGVDDLIVNGNHLYTIVTAPAVSSDPNYSGLDAPDVSVTNIDTDVAGIVVAPTSGLSTTESGGTASFTVRLASKPTATVSIGISSSDTTHGTVSAASFSFTPGNYATPQTVTITGQDDHAVTGNVPYTIVTAPASSSDTVYNGMNGADVSVTSIDGSVANIILNNTSGKFTAENGTAASFSIQLNTVPTASVTIGLSSSNSGLGTVSPSSVSFTNATWNVPQTVTVTGVRDANGNTTVDGNFTYSVVTAAATSADANYNGLNAADVSVTDFDDDINVYGGDSTTAAFMQWCNASAGGCAQPLDVSVPFRGGTVNFWLQRSGDSHTVVSAAAEWTTSGALTTSAPFQLTLGAGNHGYYCGVHGMGMSGNIFVP